MQWSSMPYCFARWVSGSACIHCLLKKCFYKGCWQVCSRAWNSGIPDAVKNGVGVFGEIGVHPWGVHDNWFLIQMSVLMMVIMRFSPTSLTRCHILAPLHCHGQSQCINSCRSHSSPTSTTCSFHLTYTLPASRPWAGCITITILLSQITSMLLQPVSIFYSQYSITTNFWISFPGIQTSHTCFGYTPSSNSGTSNI